MLVHFLLNSSQILNHFIFTTILQLLDAPVVTDWYLVLNVVQIRTETIAFVSIFFKFQIFSLKKSSNWKKKLAKDLVIFSSTTYASLKN